MDGGRPFWRSGGVVVALGLLPLLVVTDVVVRHTGGGAADFTLFLGRFHPLAVHLPIGIVLLVGAAEAATLSPRLRPRVDPAIALALPLLVLATATAFVLGQLLSRSGDFPPRALGVHRRAELFAAVGICLLPLLWAYQADRGTPRARWAYRGLLGLALTVLAVGAHFGGTLTRGDTYLTRYAPGPLRGLLGAGMTHAPAASASAAGRVQEPRLFSDVLQPVFKERCVQCHGPDKVKGGLRLDSLAALLKGGEDGTVVTPGVPDDSALLGRMLLPEDDDDHMPPEGKPGMTQAQIALVRFWIERGANDNLLVRDLLVPPAARPALESAPQGATPTAVHPAPSSSASPPPPPSGAPTTPASAPPPATTIPTTTAQGTPSATAVLAAKCARCHGPAKQKNKLRVDSVEGLLAGGKSGPAVIPGDPDASELIKRVRLPVSHEKHMPPKKEPALDPAELAALTSFVARLRPSATAAPAAHPTPVPTSPPTPASVPPSAEPAPAPPPDPTLLASLPPRAALYPARVAALFHARCEHCHSGKDPAGGLAVGTHAALLRGGDTGPAVTPGKPEASVLVTRIGLPLDDGDHMPPDGETQLSADEIALVATWVRTGADEARSVELATLPAGAVRALAAPPAAPSEPAAPPPSAPPTRAAASAETRASAAIAAENAPRGRSGGCAACVVAEHGGGSSIAPWLAGAAGVTLALRRKTATRPGNDGTRLRSG
jgi:mono/diheme cytochrome c family protein